jgi:2-isopropylmalate synthase
VGWTGESMVLGKHSGRHAFKTRLAQLGYDSLSEEEINKAFARFKELCDKKKEVLDEDLYAIVEDEVFHAPEVYQLEYLGFTSGTSTIPTATVRLRKGDQIMQEASCGDGPVDAAFRAVERLVNVQTELIEYAVDAVTGGTDAQGQVSVTVRVNGKKVRARSSHTDIVTASVKAYLHAINKALQLKEVSSNGEVPKTGM